MSDEQQKENGNVVKFGIGQLSNPTPQWAKFIMAMIALLSGIWALLPQDLIMLPDADYALVNRWIIVVNTIVLFVTKFFGWEKPQQ